GLIIPWSWVRIPPGLPFLREVAFLLEKPLHFNSERAD
ncbi:MAG: hypothetical protein ACI8T1_000827, partial [Verrucomicrobiales bacterium]